VANIELCIPESVLIEHQLSTWRRVQEDFVKAGKVINEINSRILDFYGRLELPALDRTRFASEYDRAVERATKVYGIQVTATTSRPIIEFVRAAASHDPPFKSEDRGFRDAVHLHSAVDDLKARPLVAEREAVFLTRDGRLLVADVDALD
jgi:hypothetical protein